MWRSWFVVLTVISTSVYANWELDSQLSRLHFISVKNSHIVEAHQFDNLFGSVEGNALSITVPLVSVNTLIPIRNERMQSMLFNVASFPEATFSATIDNDLLTLAAGESTLSSVQGNITLHGQAIKAAFDVKVTKVGEEALHVSTTKPYILNTADFNLTDGVEALRNIAGLKMISYAIPVSFNVVFNQN